MQNDAPKRRDHHHSRKQLGNASFVLHADSISQHSCYGGLWHSPPTIHHPVQKDGVSPFPTGRDLYSGPAAPSRTFLTCPFHGRPRKCHLAGVNDYHGNSRVTREQREPRSQNLFSLHFCVISFMRYKPHKFLCLWRLIETEKKKPE